MKVRQAMIAFDADAFVKRHGGHKESRSPRSREYLLRCPCSGKLRWNVQKAAWVCWGCGISGDTVALIRLLESTDEMGAISIIMEGYVGGNAPTELSVIARHPSAPVRLRRLPQIRWPDGVELLDAIPAHALGWGYIEKRGITREQAREYRIGIGRSGRLRNYIVFPCYQDGGLVYYQARATWDPPEMLDATARRVWVKESRYRKTLNPTIDNEEQATASDVIFNHDRALTHPHVVICEGPIDAIKVGPHAVALLGKVASPVKIQRLRRNRVLRYTVYLDEGEEERLSARRIAAELSPYAPTYLAVPPPGRDAGACSAEENALAVAAAPLFADLELRSELIT